MKKAWFSNWKEHHQVSADETICLLQSPLTDSWFFYGAGSTRKVRIEQIFAELNKPFASHLHWRAAQVFAFSRNSR